MIDELEILREATEPPQVAVAELHARVMSSVDRRRWWWLVPVAVAASLVFSFVLVQWREPAESLALAMPVVPAAPEVEMAPRAAPAVVHKPKPLAPGADMIRLETEDPDVVIYLIADGGGE